MNGDETNFDAFMTLVTGRQGHFKLESGHHSSLWLDLDALFANPHKIAPFVDALTASLLPFGVDAVCGPLLGGAFLAQLVARELGAEFCYTERVMANDNEEMYRASYRLPRGFKSQLIGKRVAIVDDVMSAGSALRGTYNELLEYSAHPVVAGALLILGTRGVDFFAGQNVPVQAPAAHVDFDLWMPNECPMCSNGLALEDVAVS